MKNLLSKIILILGCMFLLLINIKATPTQSFIDQRNKEFNNLVGEEKNKANKEFNILAKNVENLGSEQAVEAGNYLLSIKKLGPHAKASVLAIHALNFVIKDSPNFNPDRCVQLLMNEKRILEENKINEPDMFNGIQTILKLPEIAAAKIHTSGKDIDPQHLDSSQENRSGENKYTEEILKADPYLDMDVAAVENEKANKLFNTGHESEALAIFEKVLASIIKFRGPNNDKIPEIYSVISRISSNQGDELKSEYALKKALEVSEKIYGKGNVMTAAYVEGLGMHYSNEGNYKIGEKLIKEATRIYSENLGRSHKYVAECINNLGTLYYALGDYNKAEAQYLEALQINEKIGNKSGCGTEYSNLAVIAIKRKDYNKAKNLYLKSLNITRKEWGDENWRCSNELDGLADCEEAIENYELAIKARLLSIRLQTKQLGDNSYSLAYSKMGLAKLYTKLKKYPEARALYIESLKAARSSLGIWSDDIPDLLLSVALIDQLTGDIDKSHEEVKEACALKNDHLNTILLMGEERRLAWANRNLSFSIEPSILTAEETGDLVLNRKGIILDSMLRDQQYARNALQQTPGAQVSLDQLKQLRNQIASLTIGSSSHSSQEVDSLKDKILDIQASIASKSTSGKNNLIRRIVNTKTISDKLIDNQVIIEIIQAADNNSLNGSPSNYVAVIFSIKSRPKVVVLSDVNSCNEAVSGYRKAIMGGDSSALTKQVKLLSQKLWMPIAAAMPPATKKLYISADGSLNFLSFATLQDDQGKFLSETYQIAYVGSGRDLLRPANPVAAKSMVIYANPDFTTKVATKTLPSDTIVSPNRQKHPAELAEFSKVQLPQLPGTEQEAAMVSQIAKDSQWSEETHLGTDASKKELMAMKAPAVLHLATHGFFMGGEQSGGEGERGMKLAAAPDVTTPAASTNPKPLKISPMRQSGVALTGGQSTIQAWGRGEFPDPSNDGILTAEEVAGLDLDGTWLVTLSACETGVGQVQSGEGVFGLRRAFMMAGAQNLLMTLWPVSDEVTPKIMADFYKEALATHDAAGSLSDVQRDWLVKLRKEKGLLAAVRDAGPFAMVMMANPNAKPMPESSAIVSTTTSRPEAAPSTVSSSESISADSTVSPKTSEGGKVIEFNDALTKAEAGDAYAQAVVSIYYGLGYKTDKDTSKAAEYASKAAAQNNSLGQYQLGVLTSSGDGVEKEPQKGKELKVQSTEGLNSMPNDPYALAALGSMAIRGEGVSKNMKKAANFYRKSADLGYAPAQLIYSAMLANGAGVILDAKKAKIYHQKALEQNYNP